MPKRSPSDILLIAQLAQKISEIVTPRKSEAWRQLHEAEQELDGIIEPLDLMAKTLREDDGIYLPEEVQTVVADCEQALWELSLLFVRYQRYSRGRDRADGDLEEGASLPQPGSNDDDIWMRMLDHLETLRISLLWRTRAISSLSSKAVARPTGLSWISAENVSAVADSNHTADHDSDEEGTRRKSSEGPMNDMKSVGHRQQDAANRNNGRPQHVLRTRTLPILMHRLIQTENIAPSNNDPITSDSFSARQNGSRTLHRLYGGRKPAGLLDEEGTDYPPSPKNRLAAVLSNSRRNSHKLTLLSLEDSEKSLSHAMFRHSSSSAPTSPSTDKTPGHHRTSLLDSISPPPPSTVRSPATLDQHEAFEKRLTEHGAVLCEERARSVEYTQWNESIQDWSLVQATSECRVLLVRKLLHSSQGKVRGKTNIWVLSADGSVRLEHKLDNDIDIIPYTAWGDNEKVSLREDSLLKFYDASDTTEPTDTVETKWINYKFETEAGATHFQSAVLEWTLILSVRTAKTMRLHEGVAGFVSTQEQLCGLENLRLWKDQGSGEVVAMVHYKSQIHDGYMTFNVNSSAHPRQLRDDGSRGLKIRGLSLQLDSRKGLATRLVPETSSSGGKSAKADAEKRIGGIRIDFTTEEERNLFRDTVLEIQKVSFDYGVTRV